MAKIVLLLGPTAVGKTQTISHIAPYFSAVLYADMACLYKDLHIGTAKPTAQEQSLLPHYMLDLLTIHQHFDAGQYYSMAESLCQKLTLQDSRPILISGGTFFYTLNFLFGLSEAPPSSAQARTHWAQALAQQGIDKLRETLQQVDPVSAQRIKPHDTYRITRALEVYTDTGKPLSAYERPKIPRSKHDWLVLALYRDRNDLYTRINKRVEDMWHQGLCDEVADLCKNQGANIDTPAMKSIGYREFFLGLTHSDEIKEKIKLDTRHYAKRQITFLNQFPIDASYAPNEEAQLLQRIVQWCKL